MNRERKIRSAIVLAGGGTRGAYEVGVIHYMRTMLPENLRKGLSFQILCGSSVGAINSTFMAATAENPDFQGRELVKLWQEIRNDNIYKTGAFSLGRFLIKSILGIVAHTFGIKGGFEPDDRSLHFQGFFDTSPFMQFLLKRFPWSKISKNIEEGYVDAVAVSATNLLTGDLEIFVQKNLVTPYSDRMIVRDVKISPRHILASAALPFLFPPVPIHGLYYNDGGIRLNTPLAPAVSLGAKQIITIGTRFIRPKLAYDFNADTSSVALSIPRPTLGQMLGKFLNAVLLDRVQADREQIERINRILVACQKHTDPEVYKMICSEAKVKQIDTLSFFPSVDVHTLVDDTVRGSYRKVKSFSAFERFLLRILEADPKQGSDLLSYFLFEPTYIQKLIDLGFEDARKKHDELCAFAEKSMQ